jgi:23S rRNA (pseudouridine1915-N3)-methyltransferase
MRIALLQTGKTTEKHISGGVDLYSGRLKKYCSFEIITLPELKETRNMPLKEQKTREGNRIKQAVGKDDIIILLDERGREMRTLELADWIRKKSENSVKRLVFVVGGPWGFSDEIYEIADFRLSLSKLTFPHQLVRLLFMEQLYRAFTIIRGEPYHHE